ncbi:MAG: NAD(P)-dependent oxidoreductase [Lachnospiraceae bacterium]|jgi:3-hydroxyisobutyrate dehydrogenase
MKLINDGAITIKMPKSSTGWIGTGNMGLRMAMRLIKAGNELIIYNRTAQKAQPLVDTGKVAVVNNPVEVFENSNIIFASVTDDAVWEEILPAIDTFLSGKILVEMSTLSPGFSKLLKEKMNEAGCLYINAPVIGSMYMVEQGLLKVLVSGDKDAYSICLPLLNSIGKSVKYMGDAEQARYMKIAANMIICSYMTVYGEVLLAGEGAGFSWDRLNNLMEASDGASAMLKDKGTTHRQRIWEGQTALTSTALKDLGLALEIADKKGFALPLTALACQYDRFMHYNPRYEKYSTFGTIGMLEDICGIRPASEDTAINVDEATKEALTDTFRIVTTELALEAMLLCRETGIYEADALGILGSCHGASVYFRSLCENCLENAQALYLCRNYTENGGYEILQYCRKEGDERSLKVVLDIAMKKGLFIPIIATAHALRARK